VPSNSTQPAIMDIEIEEAPANHRGYLIYIEYFVGKVPEINTLPASYPDKSFDNNTLGPN
jgi:hypothetical protein